MKKYILSLLLVTTVASAQTSADYKVKRGKLHEGGKVRVEVMPNDELFKVKMIYDVKKKDYVPVPDRLLKGETVMEFPDEFRTEAGYKKLETERTMDIPKAQLKFLRRIDIAGLKDAYLLKVLPTNKKTEIEITYHPALPAVGWEKVEITFISNIPILNGYEVVAELK